MYSRRDTAPAHSPSAACRPKIWPNFGPASCISRCPPSDGWGRGRPRRGFDTVVQTVSGITHRQGELFPGAEPGPQFYPVSAIDYITGYLMAFGAMVALAKRAREGGSWLVRLSLAQTGRWLVDRGQAFRSRTQGTRRTTSPPREIAGWSTTSDVPDGQAGTPRSRATYVGDATLLGAAFRPARLS